MSLLLLFQNQAPSLTSVYLKNTPFKIISGDTYSLSFWAQSNKSQQIQVRVFDSAGGNSSLNAYRYLVADTPELLKFDFTGAASDDNSQLRIILDASVHNFYIDRVILINLSKERKSYRLVQIKGDMRPGSFLQTLTLREVDANEV